MGPKTKELISTLSELIELYKKHEFKNWEEWLIRSKAQLENEDFNGITSLLSAYGGMGSINDERFGKQVWWSKHIQPETNDNEKLDRLLSKAHSLATEIKREVGE